MAVQLSKTEEARYAEDRERVDSMLQAREAGGGSSGEGGEEAAMEEAAHVWLVRLAEIGDTRGVTELIEAGVDPDVPDSFGQYALLGAAQFGRLGTLRLLLGRSCDMTVTDSLGRDAIMVAAARGADHAVELLVALGMPLMRRSWGAGNLALHYAAWNGHYATVDLLLRHGSPANYRNSDGMTPLMYAARDGHQSVARRLVQHGVNCDTRNREDGGWAAVHYAAYFDRAPVLHTLIHAGADLLARTDGGETAREVADRVNADMASTLLRQQEMRGRLARHRMRTRNAKRGGRKGSPSPPRGRVTAGAGGRRGGASDGGSGIAPDGEFRWRPEDSSAQRIFGGLEQGNEASRGGNGGRGGGSGWRSGTAASRQEGGPTAGAGAGAIVAESLRHAHRSGPSQ